MYKPGVYLYICINTHWRNMTFKKFKDQQEEMLAMIDIATEKLAQRERKGPKRLIVDLPEELHNDIKKRAIDKNISMKEWVLRAISAQIKQESQYE